MSITRRMLMAAAGSSAPAGPVVADTFDRANSTTTLGTADTGQAWTAHTGTWGITSNTGYLVTQSGDSVATLDSGISDIEMTCDVTKAGAPGLVFRTIDNNNFMLYMFNGGQMQFWRRVAGGYTQIANVAQSLTDGVVYEFKVIAVGTSLEGYIDGVLKLSTTSSQFQTETRVGLRMNDGGAARWNNLEVIAG